MTLLTKEQAYAEGISIGQIEAVAHWNIEMSKDATAKKNRRDANRLMEQGNHLEQLAQKMRDDS